MQIPIIWYTVLVYLLRISNGAPTSDSVFGVHYEEIDGNSAQIPTKAPKNAGAKQPSKSPIISPLKSPLISPLKSPIKSPTKPPTKQPNQPSPVVEGTNDVPWKVPDSMPARDEWYRPEPGYEEKKPGEVLKWRKVPRGLSIDNKNTIRIKGAWQVQYRTTNSLGGPDATVVTILAPRNAKKKKLFVYNWFSVSVSALDW
jgi:hypothetical protein